MIQPTISSEIILASGSPRRSELLKKYGVEFYVFVPQVDELADCADLRALPCMNAELKAAAAAEIFPDKIIIAADTVIFFNNSVIGKPHDPDDAIRILQLFAGREHEVITGCAVICRKLGLKYVFRDTSYVKFKPLDRVKISDYIGKVNVLDKAGAYAVQEYGDDIIEKYTGSLENIIGLPELFSGQEDISLINTGDETAVFSWIKSLKQRYD